MSRTRKIALGVLIVLAVIVVALVMVVPMLVNIDRYRPQVIAHIQEETGKPAEIGKLTLTVFPTLSIRVDAFALRNPAGFPKDYLVKARRIYAVVDRQALWNRQVIIKSLELDQPVIRMLSDVRGHWNFENPPNPAKPAKSGDNSPSSFTLGVISKVSIKGGDLTAANLLASGRPGPNFFEAHGVSLDLSDVDINAFVASESASLAPRPEAFWGGASPALTKSAGIGLGATMLFAATEQVKPAAQGTLSANSLRFGTIEATSVKTKLRLFPKQVFLDDLNFKFYGGKASGTLSFNFAGQNPRYSTNARLSGVDVAKLLEAFPDARGKMTGTMDGNMKLSGEVTHSPDPLAGMRGTGQLSIKNGKLPSLQLNRNLMTLARLSNLGAAAGDPSSFSSMAADLNIAEGRITSNKVTIIGNGVDVDGAGTMAMAGAGSLDYEGTGKILAGQNPVTGLLAGLSGATFADGKLTLPFSIGGTLEKPQFKLTNARQGQMGALQGLLGAKGQQQAGAQGQPQQQTPADLVQGLAGMFKKKQSTQQQTK
ncbi:MAG: AsmA family protein [Acidobacteriia bacterium]|nr:AsmA family protein [Terriglobia bacterium]